MSLFFLESFFLVFFLCFFFQYSYGEREKEGVVGTVLYLVMMLLLPCVVCREGKKERGVGWEEGGFGEGREGRIGREYIRTYTDA